MATAISTGHVCLGLTMAFSGDKKISFLNKKNPLFSSSANAVFSRGYLSMNMFSIPTRAPVVCMAQKGSGSSKKKSKIVRLVSTAGTGFFYVMKKSKKLDKIELKKYDPKVKRHVLFRESK